MTLTFDLRTPKCIQLFYKLLSTNWPNMKGIRWTIAEKLQNAVSRKEKKNKEKTIQQQKCLPTLSADLISVLNGHWRIFPSSAVAMEGNLLWTHTRHVAVLAWHWCNSVIHCKYVFSYKAVNMQIDKILFGSYMFSIDFSCQYRLHAGILSACWGLKNRPISVNNFITSHA